MGFLGRESSWVWVQLQACGAGVRGCTGITGAVGTGTGTKGRAHRHKEAGIVVAWTQATQGLQSGLAPATQRENGGSPASSCPVLLDGHGLQACTDTPQCKSVKHALQ